MIIDFYDFILIICNLLNLLQHINNYSLGDILAENDVSLTIISHT